MSKYKISDLKSQIEEIDELMEQERQEINSQLESLNYEKYSSKMA